METDQGRIINNLKGSNRKNIEMEEIGHRCVHRTVSVSKWIVQKRYTKMRL